LWIVASAACGSTPSAPDAGMITLYDAAPADAAPIPDATPDATPPPDAVLYPLQVALGVDDLNLVGKSSLFATLGGLVVNGQIDDMIQNGGLLLALELRDLDDPAGQNDPALGLGFYQCVDPDGDPADNFAAADPDRWVASPASVDATGQPLVTFAGSVTDGVLAADGGDVIEIPAGPFPLPLYAPRIDGALTAAPDGLSVHYIEDRTSGMGTVKARLTGTLPAPVLASAPNFASMFGCSGATALDLVTLGCPTFGLAGAQPDGDLDGDGLEQYFDTCDGVPLPGADAGSGTDANAADGIVSCCVDGDGTLVAGDDCFGDARFADGYILELDLHATRILLLSEIDPG
jgi:hypothetical protein